MIVYYLFVHKKSVWKRKVCIIFIKKKYLKKPKKTQKKTFLVGFFRWVFLGFFGWVFLGGFFNANPEFSTNIKTEKSLHYRLWRAKYPDHIPVVGI